MRSSTIILGVAGLALVALLWSRRASASLFSPFASADDDPDAMFGDSSPGGFFQLAGEVVNAVTGGWRAPPPDLAPIIAQAEAANGIPSGLLARQLFQESSYDAAAVNSSTGAQGIAQVMPATAADPGFGVPPLRNPFDPAQAIPWAGAYLAAMKNYTGSWTLALAAYNWGPGYVKTRPMSAWPVETKLYVSRITADVPVA